MNKKGNPLLQFVAGIVLLALGVFWFFSTVDVHTGFGLRFLNPNIPDGLVVVPFLIGVVWWFISDNAASKILTVLGLLFIIGSVIANTSFTLRRVSLWNYLVMLILICAGFGLIGRVLFTSTDDKKKKNQDKKEEE